MEVNEVQNTGGETRRGKTSSILTWGKVEHMNTNGQLKNMYVISHRYLQCLILTQKKDTLLAELSRTCAD